MLVEALGIFVVIGLIALIAFLEWTLWRKCRRRRVEIDAFMEWHSYAEAAAPPEGMTGRVQGTGVGHAHAQPASEITGFSRI